MKIKMTCSTHFIINPPLLVTCELQMLDALASVTYGDVNGLTQFTLEQQLRPTEKHEKMVCAYDDYRISELRELLMVAHFRNPGLACTDDGITVEA